MNPLTNLLALADFNLVVQHGGFTCATRASGRPKASLSRHVLELEKNLGVRLLERDGRSVRLTEEGRQFFCRTEKLLRELGEVVQEVSNSHPVPRGALKISVPIMLGHKVVGKLAGEFTRIYPEVQTTVTIEDRCVDLIKEGYDAVIRVNPRQDSGLVGRCLYRGPTHVVAPPSFALPAAGLSAEADAPVPAIVGLTASEQDIWSAKQATSEMRFRRRAALRPNSPLMIRDAVIAGAGVATLAEHFIEDDLAEGRLVSWGVVPEQDIEIWVLHTSRRLTNRKVSAFVEFLCASYGSAA